MIATLIQYWTVRLPIALVGAFVLSLSVYAVFWAVTISNVLAALGTGSYYRWTTTRGMLERATASLAGDD